MKFDEYFAFEGALDFESWHTTVGCLFQLTIKR
jgi:hypothetical protein